jgi:hypothetical protein
LDSGPGRFSAIGFENLSFPVFECPANPVPGGFFIIDNQDLLHSGARPR